MKHYAFALLVLSSAACKKDEIQVYKVAKSSDVPAPTAAPAMPPAATPAGLPDGHPPVGSAGGMGTLPPELSQMAVASPLALSWKAPAGWTEKAGAGMRRATFVVPGSAGPADLSVISLPGDAGGDLPNVNRWRGQIGLPAWDEASFKKGAVKVPSKAGTFTLVDLSGGGQRMAAAMLTRNEETWFFKLLGPDATVGAALPAFRGFLAGIKPAS
ncbi:hypothetical protein EPO15_00275 [bacterium]|nr:MAG: hypothetical protein EPO15_00275 [bacterium]